MASAPLPPLPDLPPAPAPQAQDPMATLVSGLAPVKNGVDMILRGAQLVVQSGVIPGAEQPCSQIVALATSLLPMAAQQVLGPQMGSAGGPAGPIPPGPQPIGPIGGGGGGTPPGM